MALDTHISNSSAAAMLDALVDLMEAGSEPGEIHVFVGAPNADAGTIPAGQILAHIIMDDPCFGAATTASPSVATAAGVPKSDTSADETGQAGCFWAGSVSSADTMENGIIQGTAGTATTDLVFDDDMIVKGGTVAITAWTISMPTT